MSGRSHDDEVVMNGAPVTRVCGWATRRIRYFCDSAIIKLFWVRVKLTMQTTVEITLVSKSSANINPKIFTAQTVEIIHKPDIVLRGVDGRESTGHLPSTIRWIGGTARDLQGITNIRIIDSRGAVLIDRELNCHYGVPREADGCVTFDVL